MGGTTLDIGMGGYVILEVPIYDPSIAGFTDFNFCQVDFSAGDIESDDMLVVNSNENDYKKAYFIKKWKGIAWNVNYFKCKHYGANFLAHYMIDQVTTR